MRSTTSPAVRASVVDTEDDDSDDEIEDNPKMGDDGTLNDNDINEQLLALNVVTNSAGNN
ncbi:hypothetical protein A2U01_0094435, partial [Trifolium medium]|nr:hypothetical protein [Trifolium medium]